MRRTLLPLLLLLPLAACGTQTVNADDIEEQVAAKVTESVGAEVDVECPDDAEAKKGAKFDCDVTADDDTSAKATVTVTAFDEDADPPVKSDFNVPIIPAKALEQDAATQLRSQVGEITVDCPTLISSEGEVDVECPITAPANAEGVVVKVTGAPNALKYETVEAGS